MKNYTDIMDRIMRAEVEEGRVRGNSALVLCEGKEVYYELDRPADNINDKLWNVINFYYL